MTENLKGKLKRATEKSKDSKKKTKGRYFSPSSSVITTTPVAEVKET